MAYGGGGGGGGGEPVAVITVRVADDLSWTLTALGREVELPKVFDSQKIDQCGSAHYHPKCFARLSGLQGQPSASVHWSMQSRHGKFYDRTGT